jgi:hypothetical protein
MSVRKKFIVRRHSLDDALATLPPMEKYEGAIKDIDLFICAAGFEDRVLAVPSNLKSVSKKIVKFALIGRYKTNPEENLKKEGSLNPILMSLGAKLNYFHADSPEETHKAIQSAILDLSKESALHIALDISGGSSTFIISALNSLLRSDINLDVTIFYTTADVYHAPKTTNAENPIAVWTEEDMRELGVDSVTTNELIPGIHHDHMPNYVIAIPSMFTARMQRGLSHLGIGNLSGADESVYWILPSTEDSSHQWRQSQVEKSLLRMINGDSEADELAVQSLPDGSWSYCDALDYIDCTRTVMSQIDTHFNHNISIIHVGSKLQAVGVSLALAARREVSVVNTRPQSFSAATYSKGQGQIYCIRLENLQAIAIKLAGVGSIDIKSI